MYKHYIRTNEAGEIIAAFSDAFRSYEDGDILVAETEERHFNPIMENEFGVHLLVWDGKKIVPKRESEILKESKVAKKKIDILSRLGELDKIIPRSVEDLYAASPEIAPYKTVQSAIAEKKKLRSEL